jgi:hypothetical protein
LARNDLNDVEIAGLMHLLSGEIERAFAGLGARKVDFHMYLVGTEAMHKAGRTTHADLSGRDVLGIDLEVLRDMVKLDGYGDGHLSHGIASDGQPQSDREEQRKELQAKIMEHIFVQEVH